ncbi:MAG: hypothetical protein FJ361_03365 [Gemmatimonadetes bacterium]|nr:hypothetical protein [Gemmatimonadota bacterium]
MQLTPSDWLTVAVLLTVLVVNANIFGLIGRPTGAIARRIGSLGISIVVDALYTTIALGGLVAAWRLGWPFQWSLAVQLVALGLLALSAQVGRRVDAHAAVVQGDEAPHLQRMDALHGWLEQQAPAVRLRLADQPAMEARWERAVEDIRYLRPVVAPGAPALETALRASVEQFIALPTAEAMQRVEDAIREREALRHTGDHAEFLP